MPFHLLECWWIAWLSVRKNDTSLKRSVRRTMPIVAGRLAGSGDVAGWAAIDRRVDCVDLDSGLAIKLDDDRCCRTYSVPPWIDWHNVIYASISLAKPVGNEWTLRKAKQPLGAGAHWPASAGSIR